MWTLWFHLFLFVVASTARNISKEPKLPDDLYPAKLSKTEFRSKCPLESGKIDYCVSKYRECIGKLSPVKECGITFCSCVKQSEKNDDESVPPECQEQNACKMILNNGNQYKKMITEDGAKSMIKEITKRFKKLRDVQNLIAKDCDIESKLKSNEQQMRDLLVSTNPLLNVTLSFFAMTDVELPTTEKCNNAQTQYLNILEEVDDITANKLEIPYNIWFMGAEFGPIGRVATRIVADEACGESSSEFNHHSVTRVSCYDQKKEKNECDRNYTRSVNHTQGTLNSKKAQCKVFIEYMDGLQRIRSDAFYKEAATYHVETFPVSITRRLLMTGFKSEDNQSLTKRDTKITTLSFESTERFSPLLQQSLNKVSSACSTSRNIVASCGFNHGRCVLKLRLKCETQLSICLNNIPEMDKSCEAAIKNASNYFWPSTSPTAEPENVASVQSIEKTQSSGIWRAEIVVGVSVVSIFLICLISIPFCWRHSKRIFCEKTQENHFMTDEDPETKPLDPATSETSSSGYDTSTPSPTSDRNISNSNEVNLPPAPADISFEEGNNNNDNMPVIETERTNNQEEANVPLKTEDDSVSHLNMQT